MRTGYFQLQSCFTTNTPGGQAVFGRLDK